MASGRLGVRPTPCHQDRTAGQIDFDRIEEGNVLGLSNDFKE
jgi:hypothetical protein